MEEKRSGQIVVLEFPQTNLRKAKPRPAVLIVPLPGKYHDWLSCMISSKLHQTVADFDELIDKNSSDFVLSGLKVSSVVRVARVAVVENKHLKGYIGQISKDRLDRIKTRLANWITQKEKQ